MSVEQPCINSLKSEALSLWAYLRAEREVSRTTLY